jgi:hypothetical protein
LISTINGLPPRWRIVSIANFRGGSLAVDLIDPADPTPDTVPLDLPPDDFLRTYCALILDLVRDGVIILIGREERAFITRFIPDADLTVGLDMRLCAGTREDENADTRSLRGRLHDVLAARPGVVRGTTDDVERVGGDGILVRLGSRWLTELVGEQG